MQTPTPPLSPLDGLNEPQRAAAAHAKGPVLIIAGPGSGKTRVITHRIAHLILDERVPPWRILAVTFTNKAAREMRERAEAMLGEDALSLHLGTFHSMCARWLRVDGAAAGVDPNFVIYDDADQLAVVKRILETQLRLDTRKYAPRGVLAGISKAKSELRGPDAMHPGSYFEEIVARAYPLYEQALRQANALDFDDLLLRAVRLFQEDEAARAKYAGRYLHVMVDEFQDTNVAQYELARLLASEHGNICVVGDPDQSIYSWRSADIRNILNFERDFPGTAVYLLEQNYRSTQAILDAADAVIERNPERRERKLWSDLGAGERIVTHVVPTDEDEAEFIAREIRRLGGEEEAWGDIAVMYRTNALSRPIEDALLRYRVPYRIVGGLRFYQRREIKDLVAYLRLVHNRLDEAALLRVVNVPSRGVGGITIDRLRAAAASEGAALWDLVEAAAKGQRPDLASAGKPVAGLRAFVHVVETLRAREERSLPVLLDHLLIISGYGDYLRDMGPEGEERTENVLQLRSVMAQYEDVAEGESDLASFLHDISLVSDVDDLEAGTDAVTLITLHSAKGLEFPVVFIAAMEEGVLPHMRSFDDPRQMEEERRLAYVGMTRAGRRLYLTRAARRGHGGWSGATGNPPSRFLRDLPDHVVQPYAGAASALYRAAERPPALEEYQPAEAEFAPGEAVVHPKFGRGTVVAVSARPDDVEITVAFDGAGLKRLLQGFANLEAAR